MADTDDAAAADDGQPIATIANTITGPGPPLMTMDAVAHEGRNSNNDEGTNDRNASQRTFKDPQAVQTTRLLKIAPEIRNMIFKICLCHPEDIGDYLNIQKSYQCFCLDPYYPVGSARPKLRETYGSSISTRTKKAINLYSLRNLALMRTCQTVYNETAPVLWGQQFVFHSALQLQSFLLSDAHPRLDLVRNIKICRLDYNVGVNYLPAVCALLADKVKDLDHLEICMTFIHRSRVKGHTSGRYEAFQADEEVRQAGVNLGFDIYSCMHPWVTQVVLDKGVDKLMSIIRIPRETKVGMMPDATQEVHCDFRGGGLLTESQRAIADAATAGEIVRLVKFHEKKV
ncbi:hypothetical protein SLS64_014303 [Diaporthe eres]|uniref:Uncharacterized protein n=1 Tax=Diaporthe eres TaxID=83184 RepID=A0ABR1NRY1_DIAER